MLLPFSKLETHPAGTANPNGIIDANWGQLEALLKAMPFWIKTGTINGKATGTTTLPNPTATVDFPAGYKLIVDRLLLVPITFASVLTLPTLEIGEDVVGTASFAAAFTPTLTSAQIQEATMLNPRPLITGTGSLKVKINTAGTGTTVDFATWARVVIQP